MKRLHSYPLFIALSLLFLALSASVTHAQFVWQKTASIDSFPSYRFLSVEEELFVCMYGGGVFKTTDEGNNWTACYNGLSSYLTRDIVSDGNLLFVATADKGVLKSADKGESWQSANDTLLYSDIRSLLATKGKLFAGTSDGLFYTDNKGNNWQKSKLPTSKAHHQIILALATNGQTIMAGSSGYVYLSHDFGETWEAAPIPSHFEVHNITVQNNRWLIGTSGDGIFSSADGIKWVCWNKAAKNPRSLILVNNEIILGLSAEGVIKDAISMNEGFTKEEGMASPAVRSLGYHQGKLYAGTYLQGIWRYDIPQPDYTPPLTTNNKVWTEVAIYPNPASDGLVTLEYQLEQTMDVSIRLYDAFGQEITRITDVSQQPKGFYQINQQMNELVGGTYYFHLLLGERSITKPIVLIK